MRDLTTFRYDPEYDRAQYDDRELELVDVSVLCGLIQEARQRAAVVVAAQTRILARELAAQGRGTEDELYTALLSSVRQQVEDFCLRRSIVERGLGVPTVWQ